MQTWLFDWEGTLANFQWNLKAAVPAAKAELVSMGFDLAGWADNYAALWNNAVRAAPEKGMSAREVASRLNNVYETYDFDALSRWALMPGVRELLGGAREGNRRVGLVSNIGRKAIDIALARFGLVEMFDVVVTRSDVEFCKPSGEGIRRALAELKGNTTTTLFVGDSIADILAARDAAVRVAIIPGGESEANTIRAAHPDWILHTLGEVSTLPA